MIDKRPWTYKGREYVPMCECDGVEWVGTKYQFTEDSPSVTTPEGYDRRDQCPTCEFYPWIEVVTEE